MANRKRLEGVELEAPVLSVLEHTVEFLACPLSGDEMLAIWNAEFPKDVAEALELARRLKYARTNAWRTTIAEFIVPELALRARLVLPAEYHSAFNEWMPSAEADRVIPLRVFESALGEARAVAFKEWAQAAALCRAKHDRARATLGDLTRMTSTYGQLRRMVPDLANYLGPQARLLLDSQDRKSPFPPEWAAYPKDNIEHLLLALAEGHLLSGSKRHDTSRSFSWAWNA
jgi:hypothetical protein